MPMEAMPFEQVEVAVAAKCTGELTEALLAGAVTNTPEPLPTVILMGVVLAPPQ